MKVVINECFGGFGISPAITKELIARNSKFVKVLDWNTYFRGTKPIGLQDVGDGFFAESFGHPLLKEGKVYTIDHDYSKEFRSDLVEKLGDEANGRFTQLEVVEIPDGIEWEIEEYDGQESIEEVHRSWR